MTALHTILALSLLLSAAPAVMADDVLPSCVSVSPASACAQDTNWGEGCSEPNSFSSDATGVGIEVDGYGAASASGATTCFLVGSGSSEESGSASAIFVGAFTIAGGAHFVWTDSEWHNSSGGRQDVHDARCRDPLLGNGGGVSEDCLAGAPPNPGWGHLLP